MHGRKALTIDDTSESSSVLTLNPENQENQQSIHYARNESKCAKTITHELLPSRVSKLILKNFLLIG